MLLDEIAASGTMPKEYEAKLFGGGNMFPGATGTGLGSIGQKNAQAAKQLMKRHGIRITDESLEGTGHRSIDFDVASGKVSVRHRRLTADSTQCKRCENRAHCYGLDVPGAGVPPCACAASR